MKSKTHLNSLLLVYIHQVSLLRDCQERRDKIGISMWFYGPMFFVLLVFPLAMSLSDMFPSEYILVGVVVFLSMILFDVHPNRNHRRLYDTLIQELEADIKRTKESIVQVLVENSREG